MALKIALKDEPWRLELASYPVRFPVPTRYGDMDSNAHLNNVAIAQLVEESRVRFHHSIRSAGAGVSAGGVMIAHVSIDYLGEGEYPADVEAGVGVAQIGSASYRLATGLFQHGRAFAIAQSVMVNLGPDRAAGPVGPALRALLQRYAVAGGGGQ